MQDRDDNDNADVVSLESYRADRLIKEKFTETFSFVPGIDKLIEDALQRAKDGQDKPTDGLMQAIAENLEAEVLRLMTEDEEMIAKLADLVLDVMDADGIDFDDDQPYVAADPLSPEEEAAHRLQQGRLSDEEQRELSIALRQAQYGFGDPDPHVNIAMSLAPAFYETHLVQASVALRQGLLDEAKRAATEASRLCPGSPTVAMALADVWRARGDSSQALGILDEAVETHPWHTGARRMRGHQLLMAGDYATARKDFQLLIDGSPIAEDYFHLGNIQLENGEFDEAASSYESAFELDPYDVQAAANWGSALAKLGQSDVAMEKWAKASDLDPYYPLPYSKRGAAMAAKGHFFEAVVECCAALLLAPQGWGLARETMLCFELARPEVAGAPTSNRYVELLFARFVEHEDYQFALQLLGTIENELGELSLALRLVQAVMLLKLDEAEDAAGLLAGILRKEPNNVDALYYRGTALVECGCPDEAIQPLQQAIDLVRNTESATPLWAWNRDDALVTLGWALLDIDPERALETVADLPTTIDTLLIKAECLAFEDTDTAARIAGAAIDFDAFDPRPWLLRARLTAESNPSSALSDLSACIELDHEYAEVARELPQLEPLHIYDEFQSMVAVELPVDPDFSRLIVEAGTPLKQVWQALHEFSFRFGRVHRRSAKYLEHVEFDRPDGLDAHFLRDPELGTTFLEFTGNGARKLATAMAESYPYFVTAGGLVDRLQSATDPAEAHLAFINLTCAAIDTPQAMQTALEAVLEREDGLLRYDASYYIGPEALDDLSGPQAEFLQACMSFEPPEVVRITQGTPIWTDARLEHIHTTLWESGLAPFPNEEADYWVDPQSLAGLEVADDEEHEGTRLVLGAGLNVQELAEALGAKPEPTPWTPSPFEATTALILSDDLAWKTASALMLEANFRWNDGDVYEDQDLAWSEWGEDGERIRVVSIQPVDVKVVLAETGSIGPLTEMANDIEVSLSEAQSDVPTRGRAIHRIGAFAAATGQSFTEVFETALESEDPSIRLAALEAAISASFEDAVVLAQTAIDDSDEGVRGFAEFIVATAN